MQAAHTDALDAPIKDEFVPAVHMVHLAPPAIAYDPGTQGEQEGTMPLAQAHLPSPGSLINVARPEDPGVVHVKA